MKQLKVNVYFTGFEDEDGWFEEDYPASFPGNYDQDSPGGKDFADLAAILIENKFREALMRFGSLFEKESPTTINIAINTYNAGSTVAAFRPLQYEGESSDHMYFVTSPLLLSAYLKSYWENISLPEFYEYIWDHELVHFFDNSFKEQLDSDRLSSVSYLLKFRSEGIADLVFKLRNERPFAGIAQAREAFNDEFKHMINLSLNDAKALFRSVNQEIPYKFGPYMILHILGCMETSFCRNMFQKLEQGEEAFRDTEILQIIQIALTISNADFLKNLAEPGINGAPFVEKEDLIKYINR